MKQAQVNADRLITGFERALFYLTGKDDIPVLTLSLQSTRLDLALDRTMQLDFDASYLGKADSIIVCQGKTNLWIGEAIIAIVPLETWIARSLTSLNSPEESFHGFVNTAERVLQYLRVDVLVLFPYLLDVRELVGLIVVGHALAHHTIGVPSLLEGRIVELPATIENPLQGVGLLARWIESILIGFEHRVSLLSASARAPAQTSDQSPRQHCDW